MRHRNKGRKLGLKADPRRALRRGVVNALFRHGRIETTVAKAKEFRPFAERLVTIARRGSADDGVGRLTAYRRLLSELHDEEIVAKLLAEIGPSFADRPGGYTRILRKARGRLGDNAPACIFELVTYDPQAARGDAGGAAGESESPSEEASASA